MFPLKFCACELIEIKATVIMSNVLFMFIDF